MFDIGFSELLVIALVALVVLGPERLPKAARLAGMWMRRARLQWQAVKSELENELADEDMRRSIGRARDELREAQEALRADGDRLRAQLAEVEARMADAPASAVPIDAPLMSGVDTGQSDSSQLAARASRIDAHAAVQPLDADAMIDPAAPTPDAERDTHGAAQPFDTRDAGTPRSRPIEAPLDVATHAPAPPRAMDVAADTPAHAVDSMESPPATPPRAAAAPPHAGRDGQR